MSVLRLELHVSTPRQIVLTPNDSCTNEILKKRKQNNGQIKHAIVRVNRIFLKIKMELIFTMARKVDRQGYGKKLFPSQIFVMNGETF